MSSITLSGSGEIRGVFDPPGDKSISHRAVMFGALAQGTCHYTHFLESEDCLSTLHAFEQMGISYELKHGQGELIIHGKGLDGLTEPTRDLYLGNSGTSMRILLGILSGQRFKATLTGDTSLQSRPMKRVTQPLKQMGAQIKGNDQGNFAPLQIQGGRLKGIDFENKLLSAQVKSAILFAGLYAEGQTRVTEPVTSRDHTERFLSSVGASFKQEGQTSVIERSDQINPLSFRIPGDFSSAAFFIVGAAVRPGSELTVEQVNMNPTRIGLLKVLSRMGAKVEWQVQDGQPEPVGQVHVQGGQLKGTRITKEEIPGLIDELPILMIAMALAEGESLVSGAEELRVKETDRIRSMVTNLNAIGGEAQELPDGCLIRGVSEFKGGSIKSYGDHRTAMSFAIASLASSDNIQIDDTHCIQTSFPHFFKEFEALRAKKG